jgi:hypothetical protein
VTQQSIDLRFKEIVPSEALRRRLYGHSAVWSISRLPITPELEQAPAQSAVCVLMDPLRPGSASGASFMLTGSALAVVNQYRPDRRARLEPVSEAS